MSDKLPFIELHLKGDIYAKPGEAHLLCAMKDFGPMQEFFKKHFELWSPVYDEDGWPTGYRIKINSLDEKPTTREDGE